MEMALSSAIRCSKAILVLLWLAHQTQSTPMRPWSSDRRLLSSILDWNMDLQNVHLSETRRTRRTDLTTSNPSERFLDYLQSVLDLRNSNYDMYSGNVRSNFQRRLESILQDITNLVRSSMNKYKQRERYNTKPDDRLAYSPPEDPEWRGAERVYLKEPPQFEFNDAESFSEQFPGVDEYQFLSEAPPSPSKKFPQFLNQPPTQPQDLPVISLLQEPSSDQQHTEMKGIPPTMWANTGVPPSMVVHVTDRHFSEMYEISPSPDYDVMDLLGDLMASPTRPLDIQANRTGSCVYIEDIDGFKHVDFNFEWQIRITNRDGEEIWNSKCLPEESLKLRFGYDVTLTYAMRIGLTEEEVMPLLVDRRPTLPPLGLYFG